jgi:predicted ATPase/DNA-binding CsgD family transcriptional regulator/transcriptional regulator with XRE-family HTH domain
MSAGAALLAGHGADTRHRGPAYTGRQSSSRMTTSASIVSPQGSPRQAPTELSTFPGQLRIFRMRAGLTQAELAERAGLASSAVGALEQGLRRRPYPRTVRALADALALSLEERAAFVDAARPGYAAAGPGQTPVSPDVLALSNLPASRSQLIGRAHDIAHLTQLINEPTTRLVTVTGVGGTGKTRLALQAAEEVRCTFADGVWLVELAPLVEPALVARTVAAALGVPEGAPVEPLEALLAYLRGKELLLLLDNCEHLIEACANLAAHVLDAAPNVRLLTTSREPLLIAGERQVRIAPLAAPELDDFTHVSAEDVAGYAAVQLFLERAQAAAPGIRLEAATAPAIGLICSRLAGIPLALELAAARLRALTLAQLAERLDDTFQLLTGSSRMVPTRQQALRASLDWSYDLLSDAEQGVFRRLAVFSGGCELEAAETVCASSDAPSDIEPAAVLDLITGLMDKSLVIMDAPGEAAWYRLLEPLRQYAQRQLQARGEDTTARRRHAAYYVELAELAGQHLQGPLQVVWLERLDRERDNVRAALHWVLAENDGETLLRLVVPMVPFWEVRGYLVEGRGWLERALATDAAPLELRMRALLGVGRMALFQADLDTALAYFEQSRTLAQQLDHRGGMAEALTWVGTTYRRHGAYERAREVLERSLALHTALGDQPGAAFALLNVAHIPINSCDWPRARPLCEEVLARYRALGDVRQVGMASLALGSVVARLGEHTRAVSLLRDGLVGLRAVGDRSLLLPCLLTVASVVAERGQHLQAACLLGAAEALGELLGARAVAPVNRADEELALEAMREHLSPQQLGGARTAGRALTPDAAVLEAEAALRLLSEGHRSTLDAAPALANGVLTPREWAVVPLLAAGYSDRQIAARLGIATSTARVHVQRILHKLDLRSRWQVDNWLSAHGPADGLHT